MEFTMRPAAYIDKESVIDIFNYYVENTSAAYPQGKVPYQFFDTLMGMAKGYPFYVAEEKADNSEAGKVVGYALLRPHYGISTFAGTAEFTIFIAPGYQGQGIGRTLLDKLVAEARSIKIDTVLASISSGNPASIGFHEKYGFRKCGEFKNVGKKFDKGFDEIWMQLFIG
jgi:L-amino acid N-acyltransferase YncA